MSRMPRSVPTTPGRARRPAPVLRPAALLVLLAALCAPGTLSAAPEGGPEAGEERVLPHVAAAPSSFSPEHRLAESLRFRTLSHQDPEALDPAPFRALHVYLARAFPRTHASLTRERVSELSLLYRWPGSEPELAPLLIAAHLDVVPVEDEDWTHPPFAGEIADGFVWGRGALDDKAGVLASLEAVEGLLAEGFTPRRTVYLAYGHDEEVGGDAGASEIADLLAGRGVEAALSLDEGMAIVDGSMLGIDAPVAVFGVAEKGYVTLRLRCRASGGHSSTPPPQSALGCLARAILVLEENPFPASLEGVPARMLDALAPHLPWSARIAVQARWLLSPLVVSQLERNPATAAMLRTTTAVTMAEAGTKENVLPREATATVNFRVAPGERGAGVRARVEELLEPLVDEVEVETVRVTEPSPVSSSDGPAWELLRGALEEVAPEAVMAPGLVVGGTDSKHYARVAEESYRFTPYRLGEGDVARIHGVDERIAVSNYLELIRFYRTLVKRSGEADLSEIP